MKLCRDQPGCDVPTPNSCSVLVLNIAGFFFSFCLFVCVSSEAVFHPSRGMFNVITCTDQPVRPVITRVACPPAVTKCPAWLVLQLLSLPRDRASHCTALHCIWTNKHGFERNGFLFFFAFFHILLHSACRGIGPSSTGYKAESTSSGGGVWWWTAFVTTSCGATSHELCAAGIAPG